MFSGESDCCTDDAVVFPICHSSGYCHIMLQGNWNVFQHASCYQHLLLSILVAVFDDPDPVVGGSRVVVVRWCIDDE